MDRRDPEPTQPLHQPLAEGREGHGGAARALVALLAKTEGCG